MSTRLTILCSIITLILASISAIKSYEGYGLVKVSADTQSKLDDLNALDSSNTFNMQIWRQGNLHISFDILISPDSKQAFIKFLEQRSIAYEILAENIQEHINKENKPHTTLLRAIKPSMPNDAHFTKFMNLDEMNTFIHTLANNYPDIVHIEELGKSFENRPIYVVKVGSNNGQKNSIWIDGGIHAREWIGVSTVAYMLNKLVTSYKTDAKIKNLVDKLQWYIVPVLNVDGYQYTHTHDRMWRKNRRPAPCKFNGCCAGVDLNRNFDHAFGGDGTSQDSCKDEYRGTAAFSEPESKAVRDFLLNHTNDMKAFLTIHSYSQFWFYPYSHKKQAYPVDVDDLITLSKNATDAMRKLYGTQMRIGTPADILYPAAGGSIDWAKDRGKVKYSFALELRPGENATGNGFIISTDQIVPTAEETWAAISVVGEEVIRKFP